MMRCPPCRRSCAISGTLPVAPGWRRLHVALARRGKSSGAPYRGRWVAGRLTVVPRWRACVCRPTLLAAAAGLLLAMLMLILFACAKDAPLPREAVSRTKVALVSKRLGCPNVDFVTGTFTCFVGDVIGASQGEPVQLARGLAPIAIHLSSAGVETLPLGLTPGGGDYSDFSYQALTAMMGTPSQLFYGHGQRVLADHPGPATVTLPVGDVKVLAMSTALPGTDQGRAAYDVRVEFVAGSARVSVFATHAAPLVDFTVAVHRVGHRQSAFIYIIEKRHRNDGQLVATGHAYLCLTDRCVGQ